MKLPLDDFIKPFLKKTWQQSNRGECTKGCATFLLVFIFDILCWYLYLNELFFTSGTRDQSWSQDFLMLLVLPRSQTIDDSAFYFKTGQDLQQYH